MKTLYGIFSCVLAGIGIAMLIYAYQMYGLTWNPMRYGLIVLVWAAYCWFRQKDYPE